MTADGNPVARVRLEPLGRLWQQAWLGDVAAGGPLRYADWLAALPEDLEDVPDAAWRVDLQVVGRAADEHAGPLVVEAEPGGRCLPPEAVALLEVAIADLKDGEVALEESMALLDRAVVELADAEEWPVPPGLHERLVSLAGQLAGRLAAAGVQVAQPDRLLVVPSEAAGSGTVRELDLARAAAACLEVPRAVLETIPAEPGGAPAPKAER